MVVSIVSVNSWVIWNDNKLETAHAVLWIVAETDEVFEQCK